MSSPLTLMAVHAHPDDEAIGTGGVLARYGAEGIRTVLVTCTNGELGDLPGGVKPDADGHDEERVVEMRRTELEESRNALGVAHLEMLGYRDSGMMGWTQNERADSFWRMGVEDAAKPLAEIMERYRPDVVVTYDENGFYGHPDHIQAHRITHAAAEATGIPRKLYHTAIGRGAIKRFAEAMREAGFDPAGAEMDFDPDDPPFGIPDELITTVVDCAAFVHAKRSAIAAHASQTENLFFLRLPPEAFAFGFSLESFVRVHDTTGAPVPEDDLFAGLR